MQSAKSSLDRILWIGGGTDAGKSTTATILGEKYGLPVYHLDRTSGAAERLGRENAPRMFEWGEMSIDERWQLRSPEEIAIHTFDTFKEVFPAKLEDLLEMAEESVVIAEGFLFIPELVSPLISSKNQAIWMFPTVAFRRSSFKRRGKDKHRIRDGNSDPELASQNHFQRDVIMADRMRSEADLRDLKTLTIDGSQPPERVAEVVESHLTSCLP